MEKKVNEIFWTATRRIIGREAIDRRNRRRLKNRQVSIIASNCIGGVISHDLGLEFRSPFVNLWIKPGDYLKLLSRLKDYLCYDLKFVEEEGISYPVAMLNDIRIYFQHYKTQNEAQLSWNKRVSRINYDNIIVLFTDREGCSYQMIKEFDTLPYKRKVIFTHQYYPEIKSAYFFKRFAQDDEVGVLTSYKNAKLQIRYLDEYDYVSLINKEC